jgi:hypothetical protein
LRLSKRWRQDYYFYQGLDRLNKEADIGYIINQIRIMRYFLKTTLSKDQRTLLKIKAREIVPSDDPDKPNRNDFVKKLNRKKLMETYVDFMQKKPLTIEDKRLFEALKMPKTYELLVKQKELAKQNSVEDAVSKFLQVKTKEGVSLSNAAVWERKVIKRYEAQEQFLREQEKLKLLEKRTKKSVEPEFSINRS